MTRLSIAILASGIALCVGATLGFLAGVAAAAKVYPGPGEQLTRMLVASAELLSKPQGGAKGPEEIAKSAVSTADLESTVTAQAYCGLSAPQQQAARAAAARIEGNPLATGPASKEGQLARRYLLGTGAPCVPYRPPRAQVQAPG